MARERRSSRTIDVVYRFDPDRPSRRRAPRSPREAQAKLMKGNRSFAHLLDSPGSARVIPLDPSDVGHGVLPGVAPVQRPFAAVLGCSDARVPIETIFQQKSNDLFVVRVAGNGVGIGGLGSLRYAVDHFPGSLKLIVVLGHSQCGAVTSAVDVFLRPALYLPLAANYPLRSIVDAILVAVRTASLALEAVHGPQVALPARVSRRPHRDLRWPSTPAWPRSGSSRSSRVAGAGCSSAPTTSRAATCASPLTPDGRKTPSGIGLFPAPDDHREVRRLATAVAGGASVAALLRTGKGARRR